MRPLAGGPGPGDLTGSLGKDHGHWRGARSGGDRGRGLRMMDALADTMLTVSRRCTTVQLRNRGQHPT